ncbi:MAG: hypothetical protein KC546_01895 [Anaerolineae bacterium]|nr:hypothetical protein [Anaerolineae bacterium]
MVDQTNRSRSRNWLLKIILLAILIVALFAVDRWYAANRSQVTILTGAPGELLYAAGFDGFEDEWQQSGGQEEKVIEDGVMRISVDSSATIYSAAAPSFGNFDATVTATAVGGSEQNEGFGIVFRLQEPATSCNMPLAILCELADSGTLPLLRFIFPAASSTPTSYGIFLISNDGYYSLWNTDDTGQAVRATVWHYSDGLVNEGLNVANRIRVVGEGDTFQFFINGEQVILCLPRDGEQPTGSASDCQGEESTIWRVPGLASTGKLGVVVNTNRYPGTVVEFDDFVVFSPRALFGNGA